MVEKLIALSMIARSDAAGLKRTVESARPHVDRVVIGVDERSDQDTHDQAKTLADDYWTFGAADIGLTSEEWAADKIHFANARNLGLCRIKLPWVLVLDTDEFLTTSDDLRKVVREAGDTVAFAPTVLLGVAQHTDVQRLARSHFRWTSRTHNQLDVKGIFDEIPGTIIEQRLDLRSEAEIERREAQRNTAMAVMVAEAEKGDMSAMYHVAKHAACGSDIEVAVKWVTKYRFNTEVHGFAAGDRAHLAFVMACFFFEKKDYAEAELWALRALFDGPQIESLCLLGDIANMRGDKAAALAWFEGSCHTPIAGAHSIPEVVQLRFDRREAARG